MTSLLMCVCAVSSGTVRPAAVINEFLLEEGVGGGWGGGGGGDVVLGAG